MSHQALPAHAVPRALGHVMGLVTAADFVSSLSVIMASAEIRGGLDATPTDFIWLLTAYAATGMLTLPLIERLARRWHYRDLMAAGLALFVTGALWAALSEGLASVLAARVLQGIGGGGLFTMSRVYLQLAVPAQARPTQLKGYMVGLLAATAPMSWLTTVLVQAWGWQSVFVLQAGFAAVVLLILLGTVKSERHTPRSLGELDWFMVLAFGLGGLLLLHGMEDLELMRLDARQLAHFGAAAACLAFAGWRLHGHHDPLLDTRVINGRRYLVGLGFYGLYYLINGATSFIYPRLFEAGAGLPLETTGLLLSFAGGTTVLLMPLYFRLAPHLGDRRRVIAAGFAVAALALLWMRFTLTSDTPWLQLLGPMALKGLFPVLGVIQIAGLTYRDVPHEDFAHAYALKNIVRQLANTFAAGMASQSWQQFGAQYRTVLVERVNPLDPRFLASPFSHDLAGLAQLSALIDRQVTVLVGNSLLGMLALLCLAGIPLVLMQKRLQ
ncbi:MFS transporter [Uliginosibacterium paludis]|uniref:MFS transporter n=1 Tax=Uliginosibacterium paludis TaxID=1615952 RepID=A0ABV2CM45_9RHOO